MIDILPNRYKTDLISYFLRFPRAEREKVRVLVMDMWEDYRALSWLFPNAKVVADRYHWVRQIHWALDKVRKRYKKRCPIGGESISKETDFSYIKSSKR